MELHHLTTITLMNSGSCFGPVSNLRPTETIPGQLVDFDGRTEHNHKVDKRFRENSAVAQIV